MWVSSDWRNRNCLPQTAQRCRSLRPADDDFAARLVARPTPSSVLHRTLFLTQTLVTWPFSNSAMCSSRMCACRPNGVLNRRGHKPHCIFLTSEDLPSADRASSATHITPRICTTQIHLLVVYTYRVAPKSCTIFNTPYLWNRSR